MIDLEHPKSSFQGWSQERQHHKRTWSLQLNLHLRRSKEKCQTPGRPPGDHVESCHLFMNFEIPDEQDKKDI